MEEFRTGFSRELEGTLSESELKVLTMALLNGEPLQRARFREVTESPAFADYRTALDALEAKAIIACTETTITLLDNPITTPVLIRVSDRVKAQIDRGVWGQLEPYRPVAAGNAGIRMGRWRSRG